MQHKEIQAQIPSRVKTPPETIKSTGAGSSLITPRHPPRFYSFALPPRLLPSSSIVFPCDQHHSFDSPDIPHITWQLQKPPNNPTVCIYSPCDRGFLQFLRPGRSQVRSSLPSPNSPQPDHFCEANHVNSRSPRSSPAILNMDEEACELQGQFLCGRLPTDDLEAKYIPDEGEWKEASGVKEE